MTRIFVILVMSHAKLVQAQVLRIVLNVKVISLQHLISLVLSHIPFVLVTAVELLKNIALMLMEDPALTAIQLVQPVSDQEQIHA